MLSASFGTPKLVLFDAASVARRIVELLAVLLDVIELTP